MDFFSSPFGKWCQALCLVSLLFEKSWPSNPQLINLAALYLNDKLGERAGDDLQQLYFCIRIWFAANGFHYLTSHPKQPSLTKNGTWKNYVKNQIQDFLDKLRGTHLFLWRGTRVVEFLHYFLLKKLYGMHAHIIHCCGGGGANLHFTLRW